MYSGFGFPDCALTDPPHFFISQLHHGISSRSHWLPPYSFTDSAQHSTHCRAGKAETYRAGALTKPSRGFPFQLERNPYLQALLDYPYLFSIPATPLYRFLLPLSCSVPTSVFSSAPSTLLLPENLFPQILTKVSLLHSIKIVVKHHICRDAAHAVSTWNATSVSQNSHLLIVLFIYFLSRHIHNMPYDIYSYCFALFFSLCFLRLIYVTQNESFCLFCD